MKSAFNRSDSNERFKIWKELYPWLLSNDKEFSSASFVVNEAKAPDIVKNAIKEGGTNIRYSRFMGLYWEDPNNKLKPETMRNLRDVSAEINSAFDKIANKKIMSPYINRL